MHGSLVHGVWFLLGSRRGLAALHRRFVPWCESRAPGTRRGPGGPLCDRRPVHLRFPASYTTLPKAQKDPGASLPESSSQQNSRHELAVGRTCDAFDDRPGIRDAAVDTCQEVPAHRGRGGGGRPVRAGTPHAGDGGPRVRGRPRFHRRPGPAARAPGGAGARPPRSGGHVLLPRPRRLRRALDGRGPGGPGPGGGGGVGPRSRPCAGDDRRLLHGRFGGAAARGPVPPAGLRTPQGSRHEPVDPEATAGAQAGAWTDAVVSVSAPARWYYRGTAPMRRLHWLVLRPEGRLLSRYGLRTRIHHRDWDPVPLSPVESVPRIAPAPLLIVHGDRDAYFPLDHPRMLAEAAGDHGELWLEPGMGHAENAAADDLLHRIARWATAPAG
ncbi:alpha/beta hydrolase family protein [Streptomyces mexicanus]